MINIINLIAKLLPGMTLYHMKVFIIIVSLCGTACITLMLFCRLKYTIKSKKHVEEIGESGVAIENTKLTRYYQICTKTALFFFATSVLCILLYASILNKAVQYGAYGNFEKQNTIPEIAANIRFGFQDQSEEIPEDPKGSVILFYRWGCTDCVAVHDALLAKLEEYDLYKTYFVSSQSRRGKELLEQFPMESVPSGIYIRYDTAGNGYQGYVLNDGTDLNEYNLDTLLSVQTYIRCFDLPEEYQHDAMTELPEKYKNNAETAE